MASRYLNIQILSGSSISDPRYYKNALYPEVEASENDTYIITTSDDRLDLLAFSFYGDSNLWWVIASANALPGDSLAPIPGTQLRIPVSIREIVNSYKEINSIR
jgi:nucleoid-associated protein YgaU